MSTSACVAAAFRISVTWTYCHSDDVTYTVSAVALWGLGEMTAVFLVLCIPHAPKVMKEMGLTSQLTASLRSRIRITGSNRGSENKVNSNAPWRPDVPGPVPKGSHNLTPDARPFDSSRDLTGSHFELEGSGIVQTIHLSTKSSIDNNAATWSSEESFYRQHPWAQRANKS